MSSYNKSFFRCMKECKEAITKSKDADAGRIWLHVKSFVEGGGYSSYKRASELAKFVIGGYSDEYIANMLGIKDTTVRIHKRNISNELYRLFGADFFDMLKEYRRNKKEVDRRVKNIDNFKLTSADFIVGDVMAMVSASVLSPISHMDIRECRGEISFLLKHSINNIKTEYKRLDSNKVRYLLDVIDSSAGSPDDRYYLINLLTGGSNNEGD